MRDAEPEPPPYGALALTRLRGPYSEVADPAGIQEMSLQIQFLGGGVVAYLNGKEIGRSGMPQGAVKPETLAEDYPKEAYVRSDGVVFMQYNPHKNTAHLARRGQGRTLRDQGSRT